MQPASQKPWIVHSEQTNPLLPVNSVSQNTLNLESQSIFVKAVWKKFSPSDKQCLIENDFVFPKNLTEPYQYYHVEGDLIIVDTETSLGHARMGGIRLGQNLTTNEFIALKVIGDHKEVVSENQEVVAYKNLKRCKGTILDEQRKITYMGMELVNGITVSQYNWEKHSNDLVQAIELAISYLDELEFVNKSNVSQLDENSSNVMIDLKKNKVFLIDFAGHGTFNHKQASFSPDLMFPYINVAHLSTIKSLLPHSFQIEEMQTKVAENYRVFRSFLEEVNSTERHQKNTNYYSITIPYLKNKLTLLLQ